MVLVNFSRVKQLNDIFSKKCGCFSLKSEKDFFNKRLCFFCGKIVFFFYFSSGDKVDYIDAWMIIITIRTSQMIWMFACFKSR